MEETLLAVVVDDFEDELSDDVSFGGRTIVGKLEVVDALEESGNVGDGIKRLGGFLVGDIGEGSEVVVEEGLDASFGDFWVVGSDEDLLFFFVEEEEELDFSCRFLTGGRIGVTEDSEGGC